MRCHKHLTRPACRRQGVTLDKRLTLSPGVVHCLEGLPRKVAQGYYSGIRTANAVSATPTRRLKIEPVAAVTAKLRTARIIKTVMVFSLVGVVHQGSESVTGFVGTSALRLRALCRQYSYCTTKNKARQKKIDHVFVI